MAQGRPFRFGVINERMGSAAGWVAAARKAEAYGYATFLIRDHFVSEPFGDQFAPLAALMAAACATTTLRVGTLVLDNDYRHPVVLAKEAATLDLLSGGRLELGIGAGWLRAEYEAAGLAFEPPAIRVARLDEAVRLVKRLWTEAAVTAAGAYYAVSDLTVSPKPVQRPRPPIMVAGGGRRVLAVAAREADIVGLAPRSRADGTLDPLNITAAATEQKLAWLREEAGTRLDDLELNVFVYAVEITDDQDGTAERLAAEFEIPAAEVLASPHILIGDLDGVVEELHRRRERYGLSYVTVPEDLIDALAPVVARLAGS